MRVRSQASWFLHLTRPTPFTGSMRLSARVRFALNTVRLLPAAACFLLWLFCFGTMIPMEQEMTTACTDAANPMQFGMATAMATEILKNDFDSVHM